MRIIFLGTPEFAAKCLDPLYHSKHEVVAVVTQPDKPTERGGKIEFSEVKKYAITNSIPLFQFPKISRDGLIDLKALNPDIMVTAAYGQLLSQAVLDIPKYGVINVHASILPKYRGASPIQTAIMRGDVETGVTIMQTDIGLDTGDIISIAKTPIFENETAGDLSNRLASIGVEILLETLDKIENGTANYIKQEQLDSTVTSKISKNDCIINWEKSTREIKGLIHAANPTPIARTGLNGQVVKVLRAKLIDFELSEESKALSVGTVLTESSPKRGMFVKTGDGAIELTELQLAGGKAMQGKVILNGRKIKPLDTFDPMTKV